MVTTVRRQGNDQRNERTPAAASTTFERFGEAEYIPSTASGSEKCPSEENEIRANRLAPSDQNSTKVKSSYFKEPISATSLQIHCCRIVCIAFPETVAQLSKEIPPAPFRFSLSLQ